jgi:hypothetical protein
MKTIIGVLFVFLVFLSLSCQRDSGVEPAGKQTQKTSKTQKGNTNLTDIAMHSSARMVITQHFIDEGYSEVILDHSYTNNQFVWNGYPYQSYYGDTLRFRTLPSDGECTFEIYTLFSWGLFPPVVPNTSFGWPEIGIFEVRKGWFDPDHMVNFISWLAKPYGSENGYQDYTFSADCYHPLLKDTVYVCKIGYSAP